MNDVEDYKLHDLAGLLYSGKDNDGDNEWIGTEKQWSNYKELKNIHE